MRCTESIIDWDHRVIQEHSEFFFMVQGILDRIPHLFTIRGIIFIQCFDVIKECIHFTAHHGLTDPQTFFRRKFFQWLIRLIYRIDQVKGFDLGKFAERLRCHPVDADQHCRVVEPPAGMHVASGSMDVHILLLKGVIGTVGITGDDTGITGIPIKIPEMVCLPCQFKAVHDDRVSRVQFRSSMHPYKALRTGLPRNRYRGVDPSELEVIPAIATDEIALEERKLKVAAYVRVSTENDEQTSSYELQVNDFTERIKANPNWEFAGIYSDEGISGTELSHRKGMLQLIEDARAGKIDHILAKSIARFARNVVDCLSIIDELRKIGVGVHFDENNLYTLDATGSLVLTILATVAEEESRSKSFIMNWSIERRFSKGIFLTPELLGYDVDEEGNLVVNSEEAQTVKVIYDLYVNGWSVTEIAELLRPQHGGMRRDDQGTEVPRREYHFRRAES